MSDKFTPGGVFQKGARWAACFFLLKKLNIFLNLIYIKNLVTLKYLLSSGLLANAVLWKRKWIRLQNSPYFCVFKFARTVNQKVWNEAEKREQDCEPCARVTLYRFLYRFWEKKPTVLQSKNRCDVKFNLKPAYWVIIQYPQAIVKRRYIHVLVTSDHLIKW